MLSAFDCEGGVDSAAMFTTIVTADVDFRVDKRGNSPRTVFVHGVGDDLHTWDSMWAATAADFSALRYDLRGDGASVCRRRAPFKHADDLLAILDATDIERCDLIGVSLGGGIALNFALDHPERVGNLVLISPHLVAWEWSEEWRRRWSAIAGHARAGRMDEAKHLWWEHPLFETTRASAAGPELFKSIMHSSGAQWLYDDHMPMLPDVERLHLLETRALLLTGGRDLDDFRLIADLLAASAVNLQRIDDPDRGHLLHLEDPVGCAKKIGAFVLARPLSEQ